MTFILSPYERMIARRYLLPGRGEAFIAVVAFVSLGAVVLGVWALITVMSVMNGFRAELFAKFVGVNGQAVVQGYGGRLPNWQAILKEVQATPKVVSAVPLVEQPLMSSFNGRVEPAVVRGMRMPDILGNKLIADNVKSGDLKRLVPGQNTVAIGARLAEDLGVSVGEQITLLNPAGNTTPFGTVPRMVSYTVVAIFEVGYYDYDKAYVFMPMEDAQTLTLMGSDVGLIEVNTTDADRVTDILAPLSKKLANVAVVQDWRQMNQQTVEALAVERVTMFVILTIIILVAAFNILSSLIMMVRAKTRDIAILRTMGATRGALLRIFMTVGLTVGVVGTAGGALLAALTAVFRQPIIHGIERLTGQNLWDPSVRFLTDLPYKASPIEVSLIILISLAFSFLATLYPARRAANTDPVQVLRYE